MRPIREDVNGGVNHFGSPFNFPEEFMAVYRLHPLVPDMIEYRELADAEHDREARAGDRHVPRQGDRADARGRAFQLGAARWGASASACCCCAIIRSSCRTSTFARASTPRSTSPALDIIRDREHGVPRFNEFRRQIGLRQLTSFDDFIDKRLGPDDPAS